MTQIWASNMDNTQVVNEALKSARALFKPIEDTLEQAENGIKTKMLTYKEIKRKLAEKAQKKAEEEAKRQEELVKSGEITPVQGVLNTTRAQIEANQAKGEKTTKTESGAKATEKFITEYVVIDKTLIPLIFMEPNMVEIKNAFKSGQPVPGVEERKKSIISF